MLKRYIDSILDQVLEEEDDKFSSRHYSRSFFLTDKEVMTLMNSDQLQDRQRLVEICELFNCKILSRINTSRGLAMRASLLFHGALKSFKELYVNGKSISRTPGDQLEGLISSTTDWIEVFDDDDKNKIKTEDKEIIFANVRSKVLEIVDLDLSKRDTELLVSSMDSGVEEINLAGSLDAQELLKYQGNGKCRRIAIYNSDFEEAHTEELLAWCKKVNWSLKDHEGPINQYGTCYGIELKRENN